MAVAPRAVALVCEVWRVRFMPGACPRVLMSQAGRVTVALIEWLSSEGFTRVRVLGVVCVRLLVERLEWEGWSPEAKRVPNLAFAEDSLL